MSTPSRPAEPTLETARDRLEPPRQRDATLATLGAAALAAVGALALAAAVILGPPGSAATHPADGSAITR